MTEDALVTLPKTRFLYIAMMLLVALAAVVAVVFGPQLENVWCSQIEMPGYEARFGFRLGSLDVVSDQSERSSVVGIVSVDDAGPFGRAGLRPGDVPRMQHGLSSLCGALSAASTGETVQLSVLNVADAPQGKKDRRDVTLRLGAR